MRSQGRPRTTRGGVHERLSDIERQLERIAARLDHLSAAADRPPAPEAPSPSPSEQAVAELRAQLDEQIRPLLLALARDDPGHRRRLFAVRESAEYELAYSEPEPLVTVAICARAHRIEMLMGRALPSALAQTYPNLEVVIVGDAAGEPLRTAVQRLGDDRVRWADLTQRFVESDPLRRWLTGSTLPRNEAHALSRGRWLTDLDDDDALRPDAVARLLDHARSRRLEVVYGLMEQRTPSGEATLLGRFPPAPHAPHAPHAPQPPATGAGPTLPYQPWDGTASAASISHAGLRFFAREHIAAEIPAPGDYFRLERMVRAGVRFGMLDEVVYDYYPSSLWEEPEAPRNA